ncbi:hypothetical protein D3C73_1176140 [compost metagenome]
MQAPSDHFKLVDFIHVQLGVLRFIPLQQDPDVPIGEITGKRVPLLVEQFFGDIQSRVTKQLGVSIVILGLLFCPARFTMIQAQFDDRKIRTANSQFRLQFPLRDFVSPSRSSCQQCL